LYTRLLAQSVRQLRTVSGLPSPKESLEALKEIRPPVNVDLPFQSGIPLEYVPDQVMRLQLYRRLADLHDEAEAQAAAEEFADRFGPLPLPMVNLVYQMRVKLLAEEAGLASVSVEGEQIVLRFPALPESVPARQLPSIGPLARTGKNAYWMPLGSDEQDWRERLIQVLFAIINP
jgi:transcription-repair coupling factor (superfamily II helicase)